MISRQHKILDVLIYTCTIIIIFNFFSFVIEKSSYQYSDWLINYQGGFVRRAFIGEFFFKIFQLTKIPLDIVVFSFVSAFYIIFAILFSRILKKIKLNFLTVLIILSPISFIYPLMEQKVSGRKDIMFILAVAILALFLEKFKFKNQKYLIIFLTLITTFSHSGFFVYTPILLLIFIIINHKKKLADMFREIFLIVSSFSIMFFLIIFNTSVDEGSISKICNSISIYLPNCGITDYISFLRWSLEYEIELVETIWNAENYLIFYILAFIAVNIPIMYAIYNTKISNKKYDKINPLFIFLLVNLVTFPIYYIGADYGRYMYIGYISLLIVYLKCLSNKFLVERKKFEVPNKFFAAVIIFLFGFTWTIPHCCNNNLKFIYKKPIKQAIKYIKY